MQRDGDPCVYRIVPEEVVLAVTREWAADAVVRRSEVAFFAASVLGRVDEDEDDEADAGAAATDTTSSQTRPCRDVRAHGINYLSDLKPT